MVTIIWNLTRDRDSWYAAGNFLVEISRLQVHAQDAEDLSGYKGYTFKGLEPIERRVSRSLPAAS